MTFDPDTMTFLLLVLFGAAGAYFIGYAMDGVMQQDGFGVLMNSVILIAGGIIGFRASKLVHLPFDSVTTTSVLIVAGGFFSLAVLAVFKGIFRRLGY
ncbi:hypothetical protein [Oricola thermophila]|uniref:GlsB/YeaQ/YmgE family stress response membrane protein n=1 Tax=Oricola thermophila TaxID=2742145 RepID=A0A6N1VFJ2_9HYPH|nr:hypothetical protein [Oricola thermophila]QKV19681.1 hypothetical protein HTY61_15075 [Oricola thermophila]